MNLNDEIMKNLRKSRAVILFLVFIMGSIGINKMNAQVGVSATISYQNFYDNLSPYGTWIEYPGYGHVWHTRLKGEFRPYLTNGYWNYSNDGWMWNSNYNWGWAPFHYGTWIDDDNYGWLWVPGYEWSPAWVTWGFVDDYYAWAPLRPDVNIGMRYNSWRPQSNSWNFTRRENIGDRDIERKVEDRSVSNRFVNKINMVDNFNNTKNHNNFYSKGPDRNDVEKYTKQKIQPVNVRPVNKISDVNIKGNEAHVFQPNVQVPQPKEYRKLDNINSMNNNNTDRERVSRPFDEQRQNIERLPVFKSNQNDSGRSGGRIRH